MKFKPKMYKPHIKRVYGRWIIAFNPCVTPYFRSYSAYSFIERLNQEASHGQDSNR